MIPTPHFIYTQEMSMSVKETLIAKEPVIRISLVELQAVQVLVDKAARPYAKTRKERKIQREQALSAIRSWCDTYIERMGR